MEEDRRLDEDEEEESLWERLPPIIKKMIVFSASVLIFALTVVLLFKIYTFALDPGPSWILTILTIGAGGYYLYTRK